MSLVVRSLDDLLSIRVDHLPNLDCFGGDLLPLVEREEIQIASGEQMPLRFIRGFNGHIQKSRELFVRGRAGSFRARVLDTVGGSRQLRLEAELFVSRLVASSGS